MAGRKPQLNGPTMTRIFDYLCNGDSMITVARRIGVNKGSIYRWMKGNEKLRTMVKEAREIQAGDYIDDLLKIADDESKDLLVDPETGRKYPNAAAVARSKLKISTRKKLAGFYHPTEFSDKAQIDITSNGESVSGFLGLQIIMPKEDDDVNKK
jgi:transposase-like protein